MSIRKAGKVIHHRTALLLGVLLIGVLVFAGCAPSPAAPSAAPAAATATKAAPAESTSTEAAPTATTGMSETTPMSETGTMSETGMPTGAGAAIVMLHEAAKFGDILTDGKGMSLYLFDKDSAGKSACAGDCATKWPPVTVADEDALPPAGEGITGKLGVITRDDGTYQVTINDMPLYTYYEDKAAGDTTGQAVGDVWWLVGADGSKIPAQ